jgi:hypothetical protein
MSLFGQVCEEQPVRFAHRARSDSLTERQGRLRCRKCSSGRGPSSRRTVLGLCWTCTVYVVLDWTGLDGTYPTLPYFVDGADVSRPRCVVRGARDGHQFAQIARSRVQQTRWTASEHDMSASTCISPEQSNCSVALRSQILVDCSLPSSHPAILPSLGRHLIRQRQTRTVAADEKALLLSIPSSSFSLGHACYGTVNGTTNRQTHSVLHSKA